MLSLGGVSFFPMGKTMEKTQGNMQTLWEFEVFLKTFLELFGGIVDRILAFDPMLWA